MRQIVQKAVKDLSIEQTLRTYEEIWLSKIFNLKQYENQKSDTFAYAQMNDNDVSANSE